MKKTMIMSLCVIVVMALLYWAPEAGAHQTYSGCANCHGDFRAKSYTPQNPEKQEWSRGLHDVHEDMLNGDCNACHSGSSKNTVNINNSDGGDGLDSISCLGCHGRVEDGTSSFSTWRYGAALIQKHLSSGCTGCHSDSNPSDPNYTDLAGENVLPPYYANPGINHPKIPTDPCNVNSSEDVEGTAAGLDNDGDGLYDGDDPDCASSCTDNDGDGFSIEGDTCGMIDCDDSNPSINPDATEVCDGVDNNCDSNVDEGFDNDGDGFISCAGDCNDNDPSINPGAVEICGNGWDENCDGVLESCPPVDNDRDGYTDDVDCDDSNPAVNPGASEICENGVDENCDGADDVCPPADNDSDGYTEDVDCDDSNPAVNPGASEICENGVDENCDGADDVCPP
ncbi:MAG: hypothetical protein JSV11_05640, partial [Nitrospiraceae bacterium]